MLSFDGILAIEIDGEAAVVTAKDADFELTVDRPLHFLMAAGLRRGGISKMRHLSTFFVEHGLRCSLISRGRKIAVIGSAVKPDLAARLLRIGNARLV